MAHSLPYPISYVPAAPHPQYFFTHPQQYSPHIPGAVQPVSTHIRTDPPQRKRPKYTRSKTGCLTCRVKKIKCDETKPKCQRCAHGQRECTWPDPIPAKKRLSTRKTATAALEDRPMTADSASRGSDSTPPSTSRDATPNSREAGANLNINAMVDAERRNSATQVYPYPTSAAQIRARQPHQMNSLSPAPSGTSADFQYPSPSLQSASPYGVSYSSGSSTSSRSSSRPSTANSLPSSRLNGNGLDSSAYHASPSLQSLDTRDYSRWDSLGSSRPEVSSFMYHASHDSDIMSRHYQHEHANRF